jgi:hypothetical protein
MGGYGSGRQGGAVTAEGTASFVIDIKSLAPLFGAGQCLTAAIKFANGAFPVLVTVDLRDELNCFVELLHIARDNREGRRIITGKVQLSRTEPNYGGCRWWFLCPRTTRRTTRLFLPNGGRHFWSRQAYGLGYACQREGRFSRLQRKAAALNRQLGGEGWRTWADPPPKPKRMRWATYQRKYEKWERARERANQEFNIIAERIIARPPITHRRRRATTSIGVRSDVQPVRT